MLLVVYQPAPIGALPMSVRGTWAVDETIAELDMMVGCDDDLAGEATRISNRLGADDTSPAPAASSRPAASTRPS